jgi:hypothetical protein
MFFCLGGQNMKLSDAFGLHSQNSTGGILPPCTFTDCVHYKVEKNGHIVHTGCEIMNNTEPLRPCSRYKADITAGDIV